RWASGDHHPVDAARDRQQIRVAAVAIKHLGGGADGKDLIAGAFELAIDQVAGGFARGRNAGHGDAPLRQEVLDLLAQRWNPCMFSSHGVLLSFGTTVQTHSTIIANLLAIYTVEPPFTRGNHSFVDH